MTMRRIREAIMTDIPAIMPVIDAAQYPQAWVYLLRNHLFTFRRRTPGIPKDDMTELEAIQVRHSVRKYINKYHFELVAGKENFNWKTL